MGTFHVNFTIGNIKAPDQKTETSGLVDTGAAYPFVPEAMLRSIGVEPEGSRKFTLADGSIRELPIGYASIGFNGASAPCLVVFSPYHAEALFGALALEVLGLEVDPVNQRLKPATLYLA